MTANPGRVWLSLDAVTDMLDEAERWWPLETGGLLMGYEAQPDLVVQAVVGPGSSAQHSFRRYQPDDRCHASEMERIFSESNGTTYYLGDWHTHPGGSVRLSRKDQKTLYSIGGYAPSYQPNPVMLIAARDIDMPWRFATWRLSGRWRLGPFSLPRITALRPKVYNDA